MALPPWLEALLWGLLSAASLPIGAACGLFAGAVAPEIVARIMGFGAGALVYAVTVQLYGKFLEHLDSDSADLVKTDYREGMIAVAAGILGALLYLCLNNYLVGDGAARETVKSKVQEETDTQANAVARIAQTSPTKMSPMPPTSIGCPAVSVHSH